MSAGFTLEKQGKRFTQEFMFLFLLPITILVLEIPFQKTAFSIVLIPTFILLIVIRLRLIAFNEKNEITISRSYSKTRAPEQSIIEITISVKNNSKKDYQLLELVDSVPDSFQVIEGTNIFLFDLKGTEQITLKYRVKANEIGIFEFGRIFLRYSDYFGIITSSFMYSFVENLSIQIIPKFERLESLPIYSNYLRFFNGYFISKHLGDDSDFRGVRNYQNGDKLQRINWKVTSKYQNGITTNLYTNAYDFDSAIDFELIYDLTFESFSVHKECMRMMACLSEFLLRTRNRVALTVAKEYPERIKSNIGSIQYKIIIDKLLRTKPDEEPATKMVIPRMQNLLRQMNEKAIIYVITPFLSKKIQDFCFQLTKLRTVIIIQPDAVMKQLSTTKTDSKLIKIGKEYNEIVALDLLIEKHLTIEKILKNGVPLLTWNTKTPIKRVFKSSKINYL